jgi:hypothetical protein
MHSQAHPQDNVEAQRMNNTELSALRVLTAAWMLLR